MWSVGAWCVAFVRSMWGRRAEMCDTVGSLSCDIYEYQFMMWHHQFCTFAYCWSSCAKINLLLLLKLTCNENTRRWITCASVYVYLGTFARWCKTKADTCTYVCIGCDVIYHLQDDMNFIFFSLYNLPSWCNICFSTSSDMLRWSPRLAFNWETE